MLCECGIRFGVESIDVGRHRLRVLETCAYAQCTQHDILLYAIIFSALGVRLLREVVTEVEHLARCDALRQAVARLNPSRNLDAGYGVAYRYVHTRICATNDDDAGDTRRTWNGVVRAGIRSLREQNIYDFLKEKPVFIAAAVPVLALIALALRFIYKKWFIFRVSYISAFLSFALYIIKKLKNIKMQTKP